MCYICCTMWSNAASQAVLVLVGFRSEVRFTDHRLPHHWYYVSTLAMTPKLVSKLNHRMLSFNEDLLESCLVNG